MIKLIDANRNKLYKMYLKVLRIKIYIYVYFLHKRIFNKNNLYKFDFFWNFGF
jgi:hypothetical protein